MIVKWDIPTTSTFPSGAFKKNVMSILFEYFTVTTKMLYGDILTSIPVAEHYTFLEFKICIYF